MDPDDHSAESTRSTDLTPVSEKSVRIEMKGVNVTSKDLESAETSQYEATIAGPSYYKQDKDVISGSSSAKKNQKLREQTNAQKHPCNCASTELCGQKPDRSNIDEVEEELRAVIELMGPETPHVLNMESEFDEEYSSASIISSIQVKEEHIIQHTSSHKKKSSSHKPEETSSHAHSVKNSEIRSCYTMGPCYCPFASGFQYHPQPSVPHSQMKATVGREKKDKFHKFFNWVSNYKLFKTASGKIPLELYRMNIRESSKDECLPKQLIFDLVDGIPKPETTTTGTNTKAIEFAPKKSKCSKANCDNWREMKNPTICAETCTNSPADDIKVDVYYFDHGNSAFYKTTDCSPLLESELLADRTERYTTRFWAVFFGTIHIGFSFFTSFIVQFVRFMLTACFRPVIVGIAQIFSDYFVKPFLAAMFNGYIQPLFILFYNIFTSLRDICDPIAEGIGYFLREIAFLCRSIRFIEIVKKQTQAQEKCEDKVKKQTQAQEKCEDKVKKNVVEEACSPIVTCPKKCYAEGLECVCNLGSNRECRN